MQDLHTPANIRTLTQMLSELLIDYYIHPDRVPVLNYSSKRQVIDDLSEAEPPEQGLGLAETLALVEEKVFRHSVKTWHPTFFNQMSAGASFPAVLASTLAAMINGTVSTFEASPAATVIERNVSQWMAQLLGMRAGSSGIFLPGGSLANFLALVLARDRKLNSAAGSEGLQGIAEKGAVFCSDASHYSIANAVNLMGLGAKRLFKVKTNHALEMCPDDLKKQLNAAVDQGLKPFAIVATLGVTVTGGFDPLAKIIEICRPFNMHIHADAAFGGGMALTDQGPEVLAGIEQADTVTWDAHKWLHAPLTCSVLLSPQPEILKQTFNSNAPYLFHQQDDDFAMAEDLGRYTVLCGKPFHALAVWLLFKTFGRQFLSHVAQDRISFTRELTKVISQDTDFELACQPRSPLICFRFMPKALKNAASELQDQVQRQIRAAVRENGLALFNITTIKGRIFFRFILINPLTTMSDMQPLLAQMRELGHACLHDLAQKI